MPAQAVETSCLMITLSLFGGLFEDDFVMCDSSLSHMVIGLLALLPPAPVCAGDECHCHSGHPPVSTGHMLFVTAPNRPTAQLLCSPEHTLPCLLHNEWLISAFIYFYLQVKILKIFPNLNLAIPFTVISLMSSAACSSTPIFRSHLLGVPNVTAARAYLRYVRLLCQNNNPSTEIIFWGKRKKSHGAKCCELVGWWETYPTQNAEVKEEF